MYIAEFQALLNGRVENDAVRTIGTHDKSSLQCGISVVRLWFGHVETKNTESALLPLLLVDKVV